MATNVNKNLQIKLIELKQKAAEAEELRERRDKLIETFEKLNLDIPIEIKLNYDSSTELDNEGLRDKVRYYNNENRNLENYLNACNKIKDESEMLIRENHKLKRDLEMLQSTEKLDLKDYIKHVVERLKLLETERDKLMDRLLSKDCKIDIMTSKLSHILVQLQEPIKELKAKEQQDSANLSNDEKLLLKLAEISVSNDQLKTRIEQLKELTTELYNEYDLITDKIIKYLEQLDKVGRDPEALIEKRTNSDSTIIEISSTRPPSISTSYSLDIFKTYTYEEMGVALLGMSAAKVTKAHNQVQRLRRDLLQELGEDLYHTEEDNQDKNPLTQSNQKNGADTEGEAISPAVVLDFDY